MTTGYGKDRQWPFADGGGATITLFTIIFGAASLYLLLVPGIISGLVFAVATFLWLFILYFFRDPNRQPVDEPGLLIGPGDGKVVAIVKEHESRYLNREVIRISMFLNVTDVHVQRIPIGGVVAKVEHRTGKFLQAFRPEASEVNEHISMVIDSPYGTVLIKQIAGILARRCVNHQKAGDEVKTGRRFGLIKFGSRVDMFLPLNAQLLVEIGDTVYGGLTPVARLEPAGGPIND